MADVILKAEHLKIGFFSERHSLFEKRKRNEVLKDLSFTMEKGEVLGLVGESGCGKSTLAKVILGLLKPDSGTVIVSGNRPQMVFQDPYGSLNPAKKIGWIMEEPLRIQGKLPGKKRRQKVLEMLKKVGLDEKIADRYPNQLSGGQRQRVCIGEALMTNPGLLVADEAGCSADGEMLHRADHRTGRDDSGTNSGAFGAAEGGNGTVDFIYFPRYARCLSALRQGYDYEGRHNCRKR